MAAWPPSGDKPITPCAAEEFPKAFRMPSTLVRTVEAKRTFWEKANHPPLVKPTGRMEGYRLGIPGTTRSSYVVQHLNKTRST